MTTSPSRTRVVRQVPQGPTMKRKPRPAPKRYLVRYTHQGAAMTWGPFEADDMREAQSVASKVISVPWTKVEEVT